MSRADTGTDDERVRVRASRGSRPRSKRRPDYSSRPLGRVIAIDRGRFTVAMDASQVRVQAVKAREIPREALVMGDFVRLTGDVSGRVDTLARIAFVEPRTNVLRRSLEEADAGRGEKIIVANADLLVIVTAAANPTPRTGMVERSMVAAQEAGIPALLVMSKIDLADPTDFVHQFDGFDLQVLAVDALNGEGLPALSEYLEGKFSVLLGHSGVGKSTLINALIPGGDRAVGEVNVLTGKGRHTSTSAAALELPQGGWLVDTPGVRSFGLAHVEEEDVLAIFPDLTEVSHYCLPNCSHDADEPSCAFDAWRRREGPFSADGDAPESQTPPDERSALVARARDLLDSLTQPAWM